MLGTMGASAAADNKQHMTEDNDLASVFVGTSAIIICHTAVDVFRLAVGLENILRQFGEGRFCHCTVIIPIKCHQHM